MAISFIAMGQYERAKEYAKKAISYNFDLNEPLSIWHETSFKIKQDVYVGLGEFKKAPEAYEKAREVYAAYPPEILILRDFSRCYSEAQGVGRPVVLVKC